MTNATVRKQKERERKRQAGDVTITLTLTKTHGERLNELCELTEYDKAELVALLIHRKWQEVKSITDDLGSCKHCENKLPQGCKGKWKGHGECFKTIKQRELLSI